MKFTLSWLKDFLETDASVDVIADALNNLGLEVEDIYNPDKSLGAFTAGHIAQTQPHPDADRLRICTVNTKFGDLQIVCGASNARAGINVCVSVPDMYIPGLAITLKKGKIRGVESHGMLCSFDELGLPSDGTDGIMELPDTAVVGQKVIDILGINDPVIEIAITPNRPDALGVYGVARDLAAYGIGTLKTLNIPDVLGTFESPISVELMHSESCPHFVGAYIRNVKNVTSPDYIKKRLLAIGCNPKSALVDITNYMSYSFARPLHVFDADKIGTKIQARLARSGEKITSLKDIEYHLSEHDIVIADENMPHAIAGVMGGLISGCDENTQNVFLESAYFNPKYIAQTGRRTGILSDARYRFERGIDPEFTLDGAKIALDMIVKICGGDVSKIVETGTPHRPDEAFLLTPNDVKNITAVDIPWEKQQDILKSLGFKMIAQGANLIVIPPSYRPDIKGNTDLTEEIIRIYGINHIPCLTLPVSDSAKAVLSDAQKRIVRLRQNAVHLGLNESVTYSFVSSEQAKLFGGGDAALRLVNPIASYLSDMRPSILPTLLGAVKNNTAHNMKNHALFEIGRIFHGIDANKQPQSLAIIRTGQTHDKDWTKSNRTADIYDVKSDMLQLLECVGVPVSGLQISTKTPDYYHPNRSGVLALGKTVYGYFGEIHPKILRAYDIDVPVMAAEIFIDNIIPPKDKKTTALPPLKINPLQSIMRDFAFVLDDAVTAETLMRSVRKADKDYISDVNIFDIYTGEHIETGKKSVAISVTLQPRDKTLLDSDIETISSAIISSVSKDTGGYLR